MAPLRLFAVVVLLLAASVAVEAKGPELSGVIAISSADVVIAIDPTTGMVQNHSTGPVGFLFPAPGGLLFAPDLIHGATTVIDLRYGKVHEIIAGVTMPRFGPWADRYVIVAGALTIVSYPSRSLILRMEGDFSSPWQVYIGPVGVSFLILERDPAGESGSVISAIDIGSRKVVVRREFDEDLVRFAVVSKAGVLAVADATRGLVRLLDPASFIDVGELAVEGGPTDVLTLPESRDLLVVGPVGQVVHWRLKKTGDGLTNELRDPIEIPGAGLRMALSPAGDAVAVVTDTGAVVLVDPKRGEVMAAMQTEAAPRDFVWCDLSRSGPILPSWTDRGGAGPEGAVLDPSLKKD